MNGFSQVLTVNKGVAEHSGVLPLYRGGAHNRGEFGFAQGTEGREFVEVPVVTLDRILVDAEVPRVDFIKLDIQGFEVRALRGSSVFQHRPIILTEVAEEELALAGSSKQEYLSLLRDQAYNLQPISRDPWNYLCLPLDG